MSGTLGAERTAFRLLLITNVPALAAYAVHCGVDQIFVDLEMRGKAARQHGRDTVISHHSLDDVAALREAVPAGVLLVRINPWDGDSAREVEQVLARGADLIMLPMFKGADEVHRLVDAVAGRAGVVPLLETPEAAALVADIAAIDGVSRVHIGLNDLHLGLRRRFMFELLADGTVERLADALRARQMPFGIGGVARVGEGLLPAELVLGEHVRLGSTAAILSRTFHRGAATVAALEREMDLAVEIGRLRQRLADHAASTAAALEQNRLEVVRRVRRIADGARA